MTIMARIHTFTGDDTNPNWDGLAAITYPQPELQGIKKFLLVGKADEAENFEVRFFEFAPGAQSDHIRHNKEYGFYILEGKARFKINDDEYILSEKDVAYVSKGELLLITNEGEVPLRFMCVTTMGR